MATATKRRKTKGNQRGDSLATGGKPTLCTPARRRKIADGVGIGLSFKDAAKSAGVSYDTAMGWLKRAYGDIPCDNPKPYKQFVATLQKAKAGLQERLLGNIIKLADGDYIVSETITTRPDGTETVTTRRGKPELGASTWLLERLWRKRWAPQTRIEHTGTVRHQSVNLNVQTCLTAAETAALAGVIGARETPVLEDQAGAEAIDVEPVQETAVEIS